MEESLIEWLQDSRGLQGATWNYLRGCSRVDDGCDNCYAIRVASGIAKSVYGDLTNDLKGFIDWSGKVEYHEEHVMDPLAWPPKTIFVDSMSDMFHHTVKREWQDVGFAVMEKANWHRYYILTKRADLMRQYWNARYPWGTKPPDHIWPGVSISSNHTANNRLPELVRMNAAVRIVSAEPLLGPAHDTLQRYIDPSSLDKAWWWAVTGQSEIPSQLIHQVIAGGETDHKGRARPTHPDWARGIRDACIAYDVPFFWKQWGDWGPTGKIDVGPEHDLLIDDYILFSDGQEMERLGKKETGRKLDGKTWNEYPTNRL